MTPVGVFFLGSRFNTTNLSDVRTAGAVDAGTGGLGAVTVRDVTVRVKD